MSFEEAQLPAVLRAVAGKHPRGAGGRPGGQPAWEGVALNRKRVHRLWRDEGLTCKPKARMKRRAGPGAGEEKRLTAEYPMHVVSLDFQPDVTSCGRHIRFFNVIHEYTRTALATIPRRSFKAADVVAVLENIIAETGTAPTYVRCDNGPEVTAAALVSWCDTVGVDTAIHRPGIALAERLYRILQRPIQKGNNSPEKSWTAWPKRSIWPRNGNLSTIMNGPTDRLTA